MIKRNLVHPDSVILVSGGGRGITAQCVVKLAERRQCKFILLGRSQLEMQDNGYAQDTVDESELKRRIMADLQSKGEKPTPQKVQKVYRAIEAQREINNTLIAVEAAGGQAEYVSVDVTDAGDLQDKLIDPVRRLGPITGMIHAAGALADKRIEKKSASDFESVFSPKVNGLESMLSCVPASQLDFLVLFSSIVGFYGNVGQSDYAMANEVLNKSAYLLKQKNPNCHVVSINWGPWDGGMVTPELKKAFEQRSIEVIPNEVGANMLVDELAPTSDGAVQVVVGSPLAFPAANFNPELKQYEIRRKLSLEANPFLYDHMIGPNAVLPATCAATWIVNACEQLYPGYVFESIENYKVLKGIVFDESLADEHILDLKEIAKTPEGRIDFEALIWSKNRRGKPLYHYSLRVRLVRTPPAIPNFGKPEAAGEGTDRAISGEELYRNGTLFHGPSFQGVSRVLKVSRGSMLMECILPKVDPHYQGQFPVQTSNPFIYDAIVQCLLIWAQEFYQAPCLPSRLTRLEQFKAIPFDKPCYVSMDVKSQTETSVVADIVVQDEDGNVYVHITALEGTISHHLKQVIGMRAAAVS